MFIYDQAPLKNAAERKKQLYVTWFKEDREMAEPILHALSERGAATAVMERSEEACRHDDYIRIVTEQISTCNVGLVMLSKAAFAAENRELQQIMWYEVGFMMSLGIKLVLFFLDIEPWERNNYLNTTPVRQVQGTDSLEQLMQIIEANEVQEKVFYEDPELNRYASRRINYYKLTTLFNIYKKDMDEIYKDISKYDDDDDDDEDEEDNGGLSPEALEQKRKMDMLTEMLSELNCGCTVLSFNDRRGLNGELEPYYPEIHTIIRDSPIHQDYSKPKLMNQEASPEIYATVQAEFVIPVHSLLGVTFKPFLAINKISRFKAEHIKRILQSNAGGEGEDMDIVLMKKDDTKEQRFYFLLEMYTMDSWEGLEAYAKRLNHVWPQ